MSFLLQPSCCLIFRGSELVVPCGFEIRRILEGVPVDMARADFSPKEIHYFETPLIDRSAIIPCFSLNKNVLLPSGWRSVPVRALAAEFFAGHELSVAPALPVIFRACHIAQWLLDSVFCGSCGAKNEMSKHEFSRKCPVCGRIEYPRVSPAIIIRIINANDEILLAHDKKFSENIYSLIAGFYEAGERLEDTAEREVFEEVGLRIKNIRYISSQSWPFPNSLMIGFSADYSGGNIRCDGVEIEDARWFKRDNLPNLPAYGSIARSLIEEWRTS